MKENALCAEMSGNMRERFARFMRGRYGMDQFSNTLMWVSLVFLIVGCFTINIVYLVGLGIMIYAYFRVLSKNYAKRNQENQWFLGKTWKIRDWFASQKRQGQIRKTNHIFKCPSCKQKIKVPKGRGKIEIRCSKCGTKFIKRS